MTKYRTKKSALKAVKKNGLELAFASDKLKANREVVLEAVKAYGNALKFTTERLQNYKLS